MRIDDITNLSELCTGCRACIDICPQNCITTYMSEKGFVHTCIHVDECINCGKCYHICPLINQKKNLCEQHLYAAYCKDKTIRNGGSSGGIFEGLARYCIENGYYVCGAAFDEELKLKHTVIKELSELPKLLKSKYVQSDTEGIYRKIKILLKNRNKVLFCGTPCQVSAMKNIVSKEEEQLLLTVDIICHGVPSQFMFDEYIKSVESLEDGKVLNYNFRVKDNRFKHSHGFSYVLDKKGKQSKVDGIYTNSTFYNAFKNYLILRESCYSCSYATIERVGDITLGDFWGIEKYQFTGNTDKGVSMVITNTDKGERFFTSVKEELVYKQFPLEYGLESNFCLGHATVKPKNYEEIFADFKTEGFCYTANKYFSSGKSIKYKLYWFLPAFVRNLLRKLRVKCHV